MKTYNSSFFRSDLQVLLSTNADEFMNISTFNLELTKFTI